MFHSVATALNKTQLSRRESLQKDKHYEMYTFVQEKTKLTAPQYTEQSTCIYLDIRLRICSNNYALQASGNILIKRYTLHTNKALQVPHMY